MDIILFILRKKNAPIVFDINFPGIYTGMKLLLNFHREKNSGTYQCIGDQHYKNVTEKAYLLKNNICVPSADTLNGGDCEHNVSLACNDHNLCNL